MHLGHLTGDPTANLALDTMHTPNELGYSWVKSDTGGWALEPREAAQY